jgi:hypothetical protein
MRHLEARFFVLASNKKNMRGYSNPRAEKVRSNQWFYNWCVRLLLERITDYVESRSLVEYGKPHFVKLVFSQRGGHSFTQTNAYTELIKTQSRAGTLILDKRSVKWAVLNRYLLEAHPSEQVAGLQVADVIASAFFQAVDVLDVDWNPAYAMMLGSTKRFPLENGSCADYSICLQPAPCWRARLNNRQRKIFEHYGYRF